MKALLYIMVAASLALGIWAVSQTVHAMDRATAVMQNLQQ